MSGQFELIILDGQKFYKVQPGDTLGLRLKQIKNHRKTPIYVWEEKGELYAQCLSSESIVQVS